MSANNMLLIKQRKAGFHVYEISIGCEGKQKIGDAKTLKKAIQIANRYQELNEVEYGLQVVFSKRRKYQMEFYSEGGG